MELAIVAALWGVCGVVAYAACMAHFYRAVYVEIWGERAAWRWETKGRARTFPFAVGVGFTGPVGLLVALTLTPLFRPGLRFW